MLAADGGAAAAAPLLKVGLPAKRTPVLSSSYDADVIVVGGGSGGLACAREVAALAGKAVLFDFVSPSPAGTKWGLGGTCVNVGCIPKKLMHHASLLGQGLTDAKEYGWQFGGAEGGGAPRLSWPALMANVRSYIKGTNFGYKSALRDERVEYINARARVVDAHTVEYVVGVGKEAGTVKRVTAAHLVVAVGGRPRYPEGIPGAQEFGITSDDFFWAVDPPGKTLLVGAGYVALEVAGMLTHLGYDATVMARGPVLRGFDQDMAERIVAGMVATGTRFLRGALPVRLEAAPPAVPGGKPRVTVVWRDAAAGTESSAVYDTVVFATGRAPATADLGLEAAGVAMEASGKIVGGGGGHGAAGAAGAAGGGSAPAGAVLASRRRTGPDARSETTSVPSIHAVGDALANTPELTPVAIRAGKLLAHRIMSGAIATEGAAGAGTAGGAPPAVKAAPAAMDYTGVPTTIFTPTEYGCVGLSEADAAAVHGAEGIEVYHLAYDTLELGVAHRLGVDGMPLPQQCYTKLVVAREGGRVLGLHVLGPHAGEVVQGFAVAMRMGATKADFDATVGIHPTHAEEVVTLDRTKRSGVSFAKTSC